MGDLTSRVYKGLKISYRRRSGYRRLATTTEESRSKRGTWSWIRVPRRLKIKLTCNPMKMATRVHGAYVRMMMKLANSPVLVRGGAIAGYGAGGGIRRFGMRPLREYDEKMIIQMYNSLSAIVDEASATGGTRNREPHMACL